MHAIHRHGARLTFSGRANEFESADEAREFLEAAIASTQASLEARGASEKEIADIAEGWAVLPIPPAVPVLPKPLPARTPIRR